MAVPSECRSQHHVNRPVEQALRPWPCAADREKKRLNTEFTEDHGVARRRRILRLARSAIFYLLRAAWWSSATSVLNSFLLAFLLSDDALNTPTASPGPRYPW